MYRRDARGGVLYWYVGDVQGFESRSSGPVRLLTYNGGIFFCRAGNLGGVRVMEGC